MAAVLGDKSTQKQWSPQRLKVSGLAHRRQTAEHRVDEDDAGIRIDGDVANVNVSGRVVDSRDVGDVVPTRCPQNRW
jgi:hypothetical protein